MHNLKIHIFHYLILALVLAAGVLFLFMYQGKPQIQFYIGIGLAISYLSWGVIHHYLAEDLHKKHVVEYGLFALLGLFLLRIVLF